MNRTARARRDAPVRNLRAARAVLAAAAARGGLVACVLLAVLLACAPRFRAHEQPKGSPRVQEHPADTSRAREQPAQPSRVQEGPVQPTRPQEQAAVSSRAQEQPVDTSRAKGQSSRTPVAVSPQAKAPERPAELSSSPERPAGADTTLYRVSSGTVRSTVEANERVFYLEGGVRIDHKTTTITSLRGKNFLERHFVVLYDSVRVVDGSAIMLSDVGQYNGETSTLVLEGRVHLTDRGWKVTCDRARYDRVRRIAVLTGHLSLSDSSRVMHADTIFYYRDRDIADAVGHVQMVDTTEDYELGGDRAHYDRLSREAIVDRSPVLTFSLKSAEKGTVTSKLMRFDVDRRVGIATIDVRMVKGETWATCDSAAIFDKEQRA